jgi:sugar phosphate isomerase/epimerase
MAMLKQQPDVFADIGWILWSGQIGMGSTMTDRVEAARSAGCTRLSVNPLDVKRAAATGGTAAQLGRYLRGFDLEIVMDAVINWYAAEGAVWPFRARGRDELSAISLDEILQMSEDLEVVSMTALSQPASDVPVEVIAERFGLLCDRAAAFGADVHLEFMPMLAVEDLAAAWSVVAGADRANGGILFDTWHFYRGGPDFATLDKIPGDRIFAVQISDAAPEVQGTLVEDTFNRLMPGDGAFDLVRVLAALDQKGSLRWIGPEVISPATAAMAPVDAMRIARERIEDLIGQVRSKHPM